MEKIPEPVQEETPRYEERHPIQAKPYVPPKPVMEPPKPEIPKQETGSPGTGTGQSFFAQSGNPFAEVQPKNEKPQKENKKSREETGERAAACLAFLEERRTRRKQAVKNRKTPFQQKEEPPQAAQKAEMPRAAPGPGLCAHAGSGCPESRSRPDGAAVWQRERRDHQNDGHGGAARQAPESCTFVQKIRISTSM